MYFLKRIQGLFVNKKISRLLSFLLILGSSILIGCTTTPSNPRDPLEPLNRSIYKFNDKADRWVMKPVAQSYHDYTPGFIRTGVRNFFNNLNDASSTVNYGLQGKPKPSLYSFSRFLLNTTVGVLGLFDVTSGHERSYQQTDFGDTFAVWGWKNSSYLVVPLMGPSTIRDGTGTISGAAFQSNVLYNHPTDDVAITSTVVSGVNTREKLLGIEDAINGAALDPYSYTRDAWLQIRAKKTGDDLPQVEEDIDIEDLMN